MNIKELKRQIQNLAFEDEVAIQEYAEIIEDAVNRSMMEIVTTYRPILRKLEILCTKADGWSQYNLAEMTEVNGKRTYMGIDKVTFTNEKEYAEVAYRTDGRDSVVLQNRLGTYGIWYRVKPEKITMDTPELNEIPLDSDVQILLPLLCAYYVWLDDDERKATQYYNKYDLLKQDMMMGAKDTPVARFV